MYHDGEMENLLLWSGLGFIVASELSYFSGPNGGHVESWRLKGLIFQQ